MIKKILVASMFIAFVACSNSNTSTKEAETAKTSADSTKSEVTYTCPMHPDVVSNKPVKCPKCGMDLEAKS